MSFNIAAFGWHATIFVGWASLAVLVVVAASAIAVVKLLAVAGGR